MASTQQLCCLLIFINVFWRVKTTTWSAFDIQHGLNKLGPGGVHPANMTSTFEFYNYIIDRHKNFAGVPPMNHYESKAQEVNTEIYFIVVADVDEIKMQYEATILLKECWIDYRFRFDHYYRPEPYIVSHPRDAIKLWKPDTYFLSEREALRHKNTQDNVDIKFLGDGTVTYTQKLTMTMDCQMKLHRFPLDTQECDIELSSYSLTSKDLRYNWDPSPKNSDGQPVEVNQHIQLSEFKIVDVKTSNDTIDRFTGIYSRLKVTLIMERQRSYYWQQVYIPSGLVVILSWVSFFIDQTAVPARISLGLLTILTMTTQIYGINSQLPRVSYIKAIDVWMLLCLVMVIAAMFEFSLVHMLARKIRIAMQMGTIYPGHPNFPGYVEPSEGPMTGIIGRLMAKYRRYKRNPPLYVDFLSRLIFPLSFLVCNFMYWIYYFLIFDENPE